MKIYGNPPAIQKPFISEPGFWIEFPGGITGGTIVGDATRLESVSNNTYAGPTFVPNYIGIAYGGGASGAATWERVLPSRVIGGRRFAMNLIWSGSGSAGPGALAGFADSSGFVLSFCPRVEAAKSALRGLEINLMGEVIYLAPANQLQTSGLFLNLREGAGNSSYAWGRFAPTFVLIASGNFAGDYTAGLSFDRMRFQIADTGGISSPRVEWRTTYGTGVNRLGGRFPYEA